jgi:vancomycin resistance protein YoaR
VAKWVTIRKVAQPSGEAAPSIVFDEAAIRAWLAEQAPAIDQSPRNARLAYDEVSAKVSVVEPSRPGQVLDVAGSVRRFQDAAYTDVRTAELAVDTKSPAVDLDAVSRLQGRVRVLLRSASRLSGQPQERVTNVLLAAETVNGATLGPGEEFSAVAALGPVSAETGFDMVQVDAGDGTLGGGIEQVTTGLFRAALWAGLVVTERHAPSKRAAWVEPPIGLDAAIMPPDVDLRFVNDTSGILIFMCSVDEARGAVVTSVVGAPPVRLVTLAGPVVKALVAPGPAETRYDARLEPGARTMVQWARHGGDVAYQRTVSDATAELYRDAFTAHYEPAPDVEVVGVRR